MKESVWLADEESSYEELTDEIIATAEITFSVKLPEEYLAILKEQNGGYLRLNTIATHFPNAWAEDHLLIEKLFGIKKDGGIMTTTYLIEEWSLPKDIIIIAGYGHTWVALDYRNTKENPPVIYIDVENLESNELAESFSAFLNGLTEDVINLEDIEEDVDDDVDENERIWSKEALNKALQSDEFFEIAYIWDYLRGNPTSHKGLIEKGFLKYLQHESLEIRQLAANYANGFYEEGLLSNESIEKIKSIIEKDDEIAYYNEMFFS